MDFISSMSSLNNRSIFIYGDDGQNYSNISIVIPCNGEHPTGFVTVLLNDPEQSDSLLASEHSNPGPGCSILPNNASDKNNDFTMRNDENEDVKPPVNLVPENPSPELKSSFLPTNGPEEDNDFTLRNNENEDVKPSVNLAPENPSPEHKFSFLPTNGPEENIDFTLRNNENEDVKPLINLAPENSSSEHERSILPSSGAEKSKEFIMRNNENEQMMSSVFLDPECLSPHGISANSTEYSNNVSSENLVIPQETCSENKVEEDVVSYVPVVTVTPAFQPTGSSDCPCDKNGCELGHLSPGPSNSDVFSSDGPAVHSLSNPSFQQPVANDIAENPASNLAVPNSSDNSLALSANRNKNICPHCQASFLHSDGLSRHIHALHTAKPYKCQACGKKFATEINCNRHIKRHEKLKCPYCTDVFPRHQSLLKHVVLCHKDKDPCGMTSWAIEKTALPGSNPGQFRCSSCGDEFDSARACLEHRVFSHMVKECWVCQKTFGKESQLKRHIKTHTGEKTFACDHCDRSFFTEGERKNHKLRLTQEKSFKCNVCEKGFKMQSQRDRHLISHSDVKPYHCTQCSKEFKSEKAFDIHIRLHTGELPFDCQYCDKAFRSWRARQSHQWREHPNLVTKKEYICQHCSKYYANSNSFAAHLRRHTDQVIRCEHCSFVSIRKENVEIHMNKHTGAKPYKCQYCPMAYGQPGRLKIHERTHTGEKPYPCDQCDKAFIDKYSLVRHVRTHTGEKPYKCSYCDKGFAQGCQLQFHERTHTGEKPYECSICEKKFTRRQELNKHLENHKKEKEVKSKRKIAEKSKHLQTHTKRKQVTKNKRKMVENDSDSDFSAVEVEDVKQNRKERLASLRSAEKSKRKRR